jgi:hypothetical protein
MSQGLFPLVCSPCGDGLLVLVLVCFVLVVFFSLLCYSLAYNTHLFVWCQCALLFLGCVSLSLVVWSLYAFHSWGVPICPVLLSLSPFYFVLPVRCVFTDGSSRRVCFRVSGLVVGLLRV